MWMQAHVCQIGLSSVLAALHNHLGDTDIQAKALVVLGVLGQVRHNCFCTPPPNPSHAPLPSNRHAGSEHVRVRRHVQSASVSHLICMDCMFKRKSCLEV